MNMNDLAYLYVEDDPLSREALSVILKRVMKLDRVFIFEDSQSFLERVRALPCVPNIILLDIHMEPLTGFQVLEILRHDQELSRCTVIALTASVMNEEVDMLKKAGFDGVIGKPINVGTFPDLMNRIVSGEQVWHIVDM